jgi:hypothetical protein
MRLAPLILLLGSAVSAALAPSAAWSQARIFCCDDEQGRKVCGDFLPPGCVKRAYEERDERGFVVSRKEAPMTAAQIAKREADMAKKAEEEAKRTEERRRNLALLSTYSTEKDIDSARDRAVREIQTQIEQAEKQLAEATKNRAQVDKEKEFYKNKALPPQLKKQITDTEADLKAKQDALNGHKVAIDKTRQKFEEERKKFRELKGIVTPGQATITPMAAEEPAANAAPPVAGAPAAAASAAPAAPATAPPAVKK